MTIILITLGLYLAFLGYLRVGKMAGHDEPFSLLGHLYMIFCMGLMVALVVSAFTR
jgi:hypothetical protein